MLGIPQSLALKPVPFVSHPDPATAEGRCIFARGWLFRDPRTDDYVLVSSAMTTEGGLRFRLEQVLEFRILTDEAPGFGEGIPFVEVLVCRSPARPPVGESAAAPLGEAASCPRG